MLKVLSMATRDVKLGVVNSAFLSAYQGDDKGKGGNFEGLPQEALEYYEKNT